jgi:hypothetical protein
MIGFEDVAIIFVSVAVIEIGIRAVKWYLYGNW